MKNKKYSHSVLYSSLVLSLILSVFSPLFFHQHHVHPLCADAKIDKQIGMDLRKHHVHPFCADTEIGHSEEFCPICWFILQLNTSVLLVISFVFVFIIKIVGQAQKSPFHSSCVPLYFSRAPPLTI